MSQIYNTGNQSGHNFGMVHSKLKPYQNEDIKSIFKWVQANDISSVHDVDFLKWLFKTRNRSEGIKR